MVRKNLLQRLMTLASQLRSSVAETVPWVVPNAEVPQSKPGASDQEFRDLLSRKRNARRESDICTVSSFDFMSIVVEELIRTSREHIIFYGDDLPAHVFLAPGVRSAMRNFLRSNPQARITVITNEFRRKRTYVEQLAEFDDIVVNTARITMLPLRQAHVKHGHYYLVLADSKPAPSVWYWERGGIDSFYQFHSEGVGVVQEEYLRGLIAEFGSLS